MSKNMNEAVLDKLIQLTEQGRIVWYTIPSYLEINKNEPLRRYLIGAAQYFYTRSIKKNMRALIEYGSYCVEVDGGLVFLFSYADSSSQSYELAVQTGLMNLIEKIDYSGEYQSQLASLLKIIEASSNDKNTLFNKILNL